MPHQHTYGQNEHISAAVSAALSEIAGVSLRATCQARPTSKAFAMFIRLLHAVMQTFAVQTMAARSHPKHALSTAVLTANHTQLTA